MKGNENRDMSERIVRRDNKDYCMQSVKYIIIERPLEKSGSLFIVIP